MRLTEGTRRTETVRRKKRRRSSCAQRAKERLKNVLSGTGGMGVVEVILIIVEKPNAKHRYVLCGK